MRKIILLPLLLLLCLEATSQQLTHFSHYMLNGFLVNPAVAGSENYGEMKSGFRSQWAGIEGAPESYYLTLHLPLDKMNSNTTATSVPYRGPTGRRFLFQNYEKKDVLRVQPHHGAGFTAVTDKAGALRRTDLGLTYAYHLPVGKSLKMSTGITAGVSVYRVDQGSLHLTDPSDPTFTGGDYDRVKPAVTAGALLYSKRFYVGLSSAQLLQDELSTRLGGREEHAASSQVHHFLTGGYKVVLTPELSLLPSVMVKYASPSPASIDANLKVLFKDVAWAGASVRQRDTIVLLGGVNISSLLQAGYAYDIGWSGMDRMSGGSHEVVLGLFINNRGKIFSPSDFW